MASAEATNSALVFIKPHAVTEKVKILTREGLGRRGIRILAEGSIAGETIDQKKLIDQHYYAIASKATLLKPRELNVPAEKFEKEFGIGWQAALDANKVFNALDACEHLGLSAQELEAVWRQAKPVVKFGGGFYCGHVHAPGKDPIFVFNAFFMNMRSSFTTPGTEIYYFTVEWDVAKLSWSDFRGQVLGPTDPAKAPKESLRGQVLEGWESLGLKYAPDTGSNGLHASASPLEGLAERSNWLAADVSTDSFGKQMLAAGIPASTIKAWSVDPQVNLGGGKQGSLFDQLEDLDCEECLKKAIELHKLNDRKRGREDN